MLLLILLFGLGIGVYLVMHPTFFKPKASSALIGSDCQGNLCGSNIYIRGPLASSMVEGIYDSSLKFGPDSIQLISFEDEVIWKASIGASGADDIVSLVASGDYTGDKVPDYVFSLSKIISPQKYCGQNTAVPVRSSQLVFVEGKTGTVIASPLKPMEDFCFNQADSAKSYPTVQWATGTAYIGDFSPQTQGNEVVAFPQYATEGWVLNFEQSRKMKMLSGADNLKSLIFPSTPQYDSIYQKYNNTSCSAALVGECFIPNSHVANPVFVQSGDKKNLLVLTSERAVLYRPDFAPTGDTSWFTGNLTEHGGRNYGILETFDYKGQTYADLVGGCTVNLMKQAIKDHKIPDGTKGGYCHLHRHFERFTVNGDSLNHLGSIFYSYSGKYGPKNISALSDRIVEVPANAHARIGGSGSMWTVFNLYKEGHWYIEMSPDPQNTRFIEKKGWFVWDTVDLFGNGEAQLLATKITPDGATKSGYYFAGQNFDILKWDGSDLVSIYHQDGYLPYLARYPNTPAKHTSESAIFGSLIQIGGENNTPYLLIEDKAGGLKFLDIAKTFASAASPSPVSSPASSPTSPPSATPSPSSDPAPSSSPSPSPLDSPSILNGLVLYWKMNESSGSTLADIAGKYPGKTVGTTSVEGKEGNARSLNGSSDYISIKDSPDLRLSKLTVSAWIKPNMTIDSSSVVNAVTPIAFVIKNQNNSNGLAKGFCLCYYKGKLDFWIANNKNAWAGITVNQTFDAGVWYHLAGTFDGQNYKLYINGELKGTVADDTDTAPVYDASPVWLGRAEGNTGTRYFNGAIDEVGFWNRALSDEEVQNLGTSFPQSLPK